MESSGLRALLVRAASAALPLWLGLAGTASAVDIDWVTVGDPDNACDVLPAFCYEPCPEPHPTVCYGSVPFTYRISATEVTAAQYAEFLNAKAADDPLGLYDTRMATYNGIERSGSPGSYVYTLKSSYYENRPIYYVSYYDAMRFVNWLENGQGDGDTETGSYTLLGGTPTPSNPWVHRIGTATTFLPSNNQWFKAAFYDSLTESFFAYPTSSDTPPTCTGPTGLPNSARCDTTLGPTNVGSYPNSASPYGTFDQAGNVQEWTERLVIRTNGDYARRAMGGDYHFKNYALSSTLYQDLLADTQNGQVGFRVASSVPEPETQALVMTSLLVLVGLVRLQRAARA